MEEMEEVWRRLKLNDEEDSLIEIRQEMLSSMKLKGERSLVGKVWKVGKPLEFQEIGGNCFVIMFVNRRDKLEVLDGCPWLLDSHMFVLKEFDG